MVGKIPKFGKYVHMFRLIVKICPHVVMNSKKYACEGDVDMDQQFGAKYQDHNIEMEMFMVTFDNHIFDNL